jgi:hypothetical protein
VSSILLIDDDANLIQELADRVAEALPEIKVNVWVPAKDEDGEAKFNEWLKDDAQLVITDYDLSTSGLGGLYGYTIVEWCQQAIVPVGNFSRGLKQPRTEEPKLYEIRISTNVDIAVREIVSIYQGFRDLGGSLWNAEENEGAQLRSPLVALEIALKGATNLGLFDLYATNYGGANNALSKLLVDERGHHDKAERRRVLTYISGHLLLNRILRYPGPIPHLSALAAYCGTTDAAEEVLCDAFSSCEYDGPFHELGKHFWLECVDMALEERATELKVDTETETVGAYNRLVVEAGAKKTLPRHNCQRCQGENGGFWCPFTKRAVCLRPNCSVAATSWIPRGAQLSRIERDFYDEWAPILGI